jgi:hypothetical protein
MWDEECNGVAKIVFIRIDKTKGKAAISREYNLPTNSRTGQGLPNHVQAIRSIALKLLFYRF